MRRASHPCASLLSAAFVLAASAVASAALAYPPPADKQPRPAAQNDVAEALGVRFVDEDIATAVRMFDAGQKQEAIDHLKKVIADPNAAKNKERDGELKAALGVLQARAGLRPQGESALRPLAETSPDPSLKARARVLLAAAIGSYKEGTKSSRDIGTRDGWLDAVRAARRDLEIKLQQADARTSDMVSRSQWGSLKSATTAADDVADQVDAIEVDRSQSDQILTKHEGVLTAASKQLADSIAEHNAAMKRMEKERNHSRGPNNRDHKKDLTEEIAKERETIRTLQEAQKVIDEARDGGGGDKPAGGKRRKNRK